MQKLYPFIVKTLLLAVAAVIFSTQLTKAQATYVPYSYQYDQKFNSSVYSTGNSAHTSLKPFIIDSALMPRYKELNSLGVDTTEKRWIPRKIFDEHLFEVKDDVFTFYGDYLTDFQFGRDMSTLNHVKTHLNTNLNTRGYQFGGTVGKNFFFYTSGYENQARFPTYYTNIINSENFVPGQAFARPLAGNSKDWSYVTAILSYTPIKQLNITLGEDKTFIGDGYRSLLLSDYAANYPLLRLTANLGKVQYMMMWAYLEDQNATQVDPFGNNRRKWAAFHYIDWNISNRVSVGFFNALMTEEMNDAGQYHPFDINYVNPVIFSASKGQKYLQDNVLAGFTAKYKIFDKTAIYGQLLLDRFKLSDFTSTANMDNTNGVQLGIRGADIFKVKNLNYIFEYNTVKPYTYASQQPIVDYTHYNESLADPLGANFKEYIGIVNYSWQRFDFMLELESQKFGLDPAASGDFGGDITKPLLNASLATTKTGQVLPANTKYAEATIGFIINPKTNLRFELGLIGRQETYPGFDMKTSFVTFGIRSSFRSIYHDF
jgi:hypothetical protein